MGTIVTNKLNIITNAFSGGSCAKQLPKTFFWEFNKYPSNLGPVVYFDEAIISLYNDGYTGIKYGWIGESTEIVFNVIQTISDHLNKFKENYFKIFTNDRRLIELDNSFFVYNPPASNVPWITDTSMYEKKQLCSFITSFKDYTSGHKKRINLFLQLKDNEIFKDHIYGRSYRQIDNKLEGLKDYMFSIAMENSCYPKYYTEKVTDCFATGTIPIYYGDKSICEDFDSDGIIFLEDLNDFNDLTPDLYYSKIDAIKNNFETVKNLKTADDILYEKVKELNCE